LKARSRQHEPSHRRHRHCLDFRECGDDGLGAISTPGPIEQPAPLVREAFASPYGRVLITELGRALRADAAPACLKSKGIAADQLEAWRSAADQMGHTGDGNRDDSHRFRSL